MRRIAYAACRHATLTGSSDASWSIDSPEKETLPCPAQISHAVGSFA